MDDDYSVEELEQIMADGMTYAECTNGCGYGSNIEPDGDYKCPECGTGRLTSPLVTMGLI